MSDKTLGAYERHEPLTADDFARAEFARHEDGRIAHRAGPDLWVYNQQSSLAPVWSTCRDMAEDGGWSPVRECPDPDVHTRVTNPASAYWQGMYDDALEEVERDRDDARRWLSETEALLDQAGHERDEALRTLKEALDSHDETLRDIASGKYTAESRPVTPEDITDEMVKRGVEAYLRGGETVVGVVRAVLTAALTPEPERPDGAEAIVALLDDYGMDDFEERDLLAEWLAEHGVRVVGEEDR